MNTHPHTHCSADQEDKADMERHKQPLEEELNCVLKETHADTLRDPRNPVCRLTAVRTKGSDSEESRKGCWARGRGGAKRHDCGSNAPGLRIKFKRLALFTEKTRCFSVDAQQSA